MVHVPLHNQLENPKPTLHCKSRPTPHATSPQGEFLISCSIKASTHRLKIITYQWSTRWL